MKFDVIGLDSPCVDLAVNVRCFPKPNGAERIQNLSWQGGGKVASGMVAAARLGLCCGIMGNVGDDKYGTFCLRDFQDHGIDTEQMCVRKNRTTNFDIVIMNELLDLFLDTQNAARFASGVAAIKCTRIGGRAGIPNWEVTDNFLETGEIDYREIDERVKKYGRGLEYV